MKKILLFIGLVTMNLMASYAQKSHYIPYEWRNAGSDTLLYKESDPNNEYTWSESRSIESDNVIIYWDKYYGNTRPSNAASAYRVDIDDLLEKAEAFYKLEIEELGFVSADTSNLSKYKVMVLLNHTTDWICYGGGYDYNCSALWLSPSTCKPVGQAVAHEVGHSFHYMCYSEASKHGALSNVQTGFHSAIGSGSVTWEQTAQWQSLQTYPELMYSQSIGVFRNSHNYAFTHEWHRYQSYWFFYYLCQYYNDIQTIANVWNYPETKAKDFNEVLMDYKGLSVEDLFKMYYDYASHLVTWDLDVCKPYRDNYIGDFTYNAISLGGTKYQVAYSSCPQSTGFNVIPLNVPESGKTVTTKFTALSTGSDLAEGDPATYLDGNSVYSSSGRTAYNAVGYANARGFRLGYVALLEDGTRVYESVDSVYCPGRKVDSVEVSFTVPENVSQMWFVVCPSPSRYFQHKWDDKFSNDDQWPYQVEFENTNISGKPILDGRTAEDITLTYDIYFAPDAKNYSGLTLQLSDEILAMIGTALQIDPDGINNMIVSYSASGPSSGKIMFYPANSDGSLISSGSTANGYGHWFNTSGGVTSWGSNAYVFSEYYPSSEYFSIGQYPGKCSEGDEYQVCQALVYNNGEKLVKVLFVFNIHTTSSKTGYSLLGVDYDEDAADVKSVGFASDKVDVYTLSGVRVKSGVFSDAALQGLSNGIYIVGGKKMIVR